MYGDCRTGGACKDIMTSLTHSQTRLADSGYYLTNIYEYVHGTDLQDIDVRSLYMRKRTCMSS